MRMPRVLRSVRLPAVLLLVALAVPVAASSQTDFRGPPALSAARGESLTRAASDASLPSWQWRLMLRLAGRDPTLDDGAVTARARASGAADGEWTKREVGAYPAVGYGQSAIHDPVRDRVLVYGGCGDRGCFDSVWALSLGEAPAWTELVSSGTPPAALSDQSAIYDPVRDRMVVFGGWGEEGDLNGVWALSLVDPSAWTELSPTGTPPSVRSGHSAVYDPVRDRMVVFGGSSGSPFNDVWALSLGATPAWAELSPIGTPPSVRTAHDAIYDPVRDRMVVFGGWDEAGVLDDVWALSLGDTVAWMQLSPAGTPPAAQLGHGAIYDPVRDRMVVCGDHDDGEQSPLRVWALSLAGPPAWTELSPAGTSPGDRVQESAIYDPARDCMVICGGTGGDGWMPLFDDAWALSLADPPAWTALSATGLRPEGRWSHSAIYDLASGRMVVFGGAGASGFFDDVWVLPLFQEPDWMRLSPSGPGPCARSEHGAIYDPVRGCMVVFGGRASSEPLDDAWVLSLGAAPAWTKLTPTGTAPNARWGHSAIYDPVGDRMVVFGGTNGGSLFGDVWALSLAGTPAWTKLAPGGAMPSARANHSAIYDPVLDRMVVFGGYDGEWQGFLDAWALSLANPPVWTALAPGGSLPGPRRFHSAVYDPVHHRALVFGGYDGSFSYRDDTWALSLGWTELAPAGERPAARGFHSAILYDSYSPRMLVFGGGTAGGPFSTLAYDDDVWELALGSATGDVEAQTGPGASGLFAPSPNPSRGPTTVRYSIARAGLVELGVYDLGGRLVRRLASGERRAGTWSAVWDGTGESGTQAGVGVYFVRLSGPGVRQTRKVVLIR
jgi:hypothetical protein